MDITPHQNPANLVLPLQLYAKTLIASAVSLDNENFEIYAGLDEKLAAELKERSLDESDEALKITSDRLRFGEGSYENWFRKGRVPFALVHKESGQLAALSWFGPKPLGRKPISHLNDQERRQDESALDSDNWHTVSYRSYPPFRGRGLMKSFVGFTLDIYESHYPGAKFWEGVDANNPASTALAEKLGFKVDTEASDINAKWLIMVRNAR